jgi:hypothetical protein
MRDLMNEHAFEVDIKIRLLILEDRSFNITFK